MAQKTGSFLRPKVCIVEKNVKELYIAYTQFYLSCGKLIKLRRNDYIQRNKLLRANSVTHATLQMILHEMYGFEYQVQSFPTIKKRLLIFI